MHRDGLFTVYGFAHSLGSLGILGGGEIFYAKPNEIIMAGS